MKRADGPLRRLTPRQAELVHWIGHHMKNPQIAAQMGVATGTVKHYIQSLAMLFDDYAELRGSVGAKERIRLWVDRLRLDLGHVPSIEELIEASSPPGAAGGLLPSAIPSSSPSGHSRVS